MKRRNEFFALAVGAFVSMIAVVLAGVVSAQEIKVEVAANAALLEGPAADRAGNVYFCDVQGGRIMRLDPEGKLGVYRQNSNRAVGLLIDSQGRLLACEAGGAVGDDGKSKGVPRVTRTDLDTGAVEILAENCEGKPFAGPNDLTVDGRGRIYFTDMEGAAVYRVDEPGKASRLLSTPEVKTPNGILVAPDDRTLYLAESGKGVSDPREIRAFDLLPDGSLRNGHTFYRFYPGRSADGLSTDAEGNVYASAGMNELRGTSETLDVKAGVYVIAPDGKLLGFIPVPQNMATNNTFGGAERKTLYITAGPTLYKVHNAVADLSR